MKSKPVPQLVIVGSIGLDTIETVRDKREDVLGGSASYLAPDEIEQLRSRAKRDVLLMHYTPEASQTAPGLDRRQAEDSLQATTAASTSQTRIGRYIASILPGKQEHTEAVQAGAARAVAGGTAWND